MSGERNAPTTGSDGRSAAANREFGYLVKRSWTRLWWCGSNPHTVYRALKRERLIATLSKAKKGDDRGA